MLKNAVIIFVYLSSFFTAYSQENDVISELKLKLKTEKRDTAKINIMIDIGSHFYDNLNVLNAKIFLNQALIKSKRISYHKGVIQASSGLSACYYLQGNTDSALVFSRFSLKYSSSNKVDKDLFARALLDHSTIFTQLNQLDSSLHYAFKAKEISDGEYYIEALSSIAYTYKFKSEYKPAIYFFLKALSISNQRKGELKPEILGGLSDTYLGLEDTLKSKKYLKQSMELNNLDKTSNLNYYWRLARLESDPNKKLFYAQQGYHVALDAKLDGHVASYTKDIADAYYNLNNIDSAIMYYKKALFFFEKQKDHTVRINACLRLARAYVIKTDFKQAEFFVNKALELNKPRNLVVVLSSYSLLSKINEHKKNYKLALIYLRKHNEIDDSVFNEEKHLQITEIETKYQTKEKEALNKQLAIKNKLILQEKQNEQQKGRFYLFGGLGLVFSIAIGSLFYSRQRKFRFENEQFKLEQKLLRSQMNPHFMSNFLMAVKRSVKDERSEVAIQRLDQFASLSRQVLEASINDFILLEDEVNFIQNYLELQQLVSHNKFNFRIELSEDIDPSEIMIPPMLLQPFIENAVDHGFRGMEENGLIEIKFSLNDDKILAEIIDNGVGIEKQEYSEHPKRISRSTEIINSRIELFKKKWNRDIVFNILDLSIGTKVIFKLPIKEVFSA